MAIVSLGCAKNQVDSENLAGILHRAGCTIVAEPSQAETVIVNTCGFIEAAIRESVEVILDLEERKERGEIQAIAVVGCLVNRYEDELREELPTVDYWARSEEWSMLCGALTKEASPAGENRQRLLPGYPWWTRYLKVADGCDNRCTYCTIPSIRGPLRSLPEKRIVDEAEQLVRCGARELCLVGQDIASYGKEQGPSRLAGLLEMLSSALPEDIWIRLLYLHPDNIPPHFWERLAALPQVLPYADIPVQHSHPAILQRMNRNPDTERLHALLRAPRDLDEGFALRTTTMVGFPGETEEMFDSLLATIAEIKFDNLGVFCFSPEEGTPAATFPDPVDRETAEERKERVLELQEAIALERSEAMVGAELDVLVEGYHREDGLLWGRSYRDAPEVDGSVVVAAPEDAVTPGERIPVVIEEALGYELRGRIREA